MLLQAPFPKGVNVVTTLLNKNIRNSQTNGAGWDYVECEWELAPGLAVAMVGFYPGHANVDADGEASIIHYIDDDGVTSLPNMGSDRLKWSSTDEFQVVTSGGGNSGFVPYTLPGPIVVVKDGTIAFQAPTANDEIFVWIYYHLIEVSDADLIRLYGLSLSR